jgi:hypothetical protein
MQTKSKATGLRRSDRRLCFQFKSSKLIKGNVTKLSSFMNTSNSYRASRYISLQLNDLLEGVTEIQLLPSNNVTRALLSQVYFITIIQSTGTPL